LNDTVWSIEERSPAAARGGTIVSFEALPLGYREWRVRSCTWPLPVR